MNSDAATASSARPVQLHSPEPEWKKHACRMGASARQFFSSLWHFWFDTLSIGYQFEMLANKVTACGRIVVSVKRKSVSGSRVRQCEKYVLSSRVGFALCYYTGCCCILQCVNAMKCYLSFFQRYIRIPPFQINMYRLQQKEREGEKERTVFFTKEKFLINRS